MEEATNVLWNLLTRLFFLMAKVVIEVAFALSLAIVAFYLLPRINAPPPVILEAETYGTIPALLFSIALYKGWCWSVAEERISA